MMKTVPRELPLHCGRLKSTARRLIDRFRRDVSTRRRARRIQIATLPGTPEISKRNLEAILNAAQGDEAFGLLDRTLIEAAATSDRLRVGELLALRWGDIDWIAGTVRVDRTLHSNQLVLPKPGQRRTVRLAPHTRRSLRRYRACLDAPSPGDLVFQDPNGRDFLDVRRLRLRFRAALEQAGFREIQLPLLHPAFRAPWWSRYR